MRPVFKTDGVFTELRHAAFERGAEFLQQPFFGDRTGGHARAAVGVNELPLNAAVEVEFVIAVADAAGA